MRQREGVREDSCGHLNSSHSRLLVISFLVAPSAQTFQLKTLTHKDQREKERERERERER